MVILLRRKVFLPWQASIILWLGNKWALQLNEWAFLDLHRLWTTTTYFAWLFLVTTTTYFTWLFLVTHHPVYARAVTSPCYFSPPSLWLQWPKPSGGSRETDEWPRSSEDNPLSTYCSLLWRVERKGPRSRSLLAFFNFWGWPQKQKLLSAEVSHTAGK